MTIATKTFARRMREERRRMGMTQAELAERLAEAVGRPVDDSAIARAEAHRRGIRLDEAIAITEILDTPLAALLRDRDAVDDEIDELQRDLDAARWKAGQAEVAFREAQDALQGIRWRIAELEATRGH